jgi:hypothetical protein
MDRRTAVRSLIVVGAASYLGFGGVLKRDNEETIRCKLEDFWDTVKYKEERINGQIQRNIYRIEDYPTCSTFKRIKFEQLRINDHFIIVTSKLDYMGPSTGYGYISRANSGVFEDSGTFGVQLSYKSMPQCWTEEAFEKHMILSGGDYHGPTGHYKNGVKIG